MQKGLVPIALSIEAGIPVVSANDASLRDTKNGNPSICGGNTGEVSDADVYVDRGPSRRLIGSLGNVAHNGAPDCIMADNHRKGYSSLMLWTDPSPCARPPCRICDTTPECQDIKPLRKW